MAYKVVVTNDAKENMQEYINTSYMKKRIGRQQEVCLMILNILKIY